MRSLTEHGAVQTRPARALTRLVRRETFRDAVFL